MLQLLTKSCLLIITLTHYSRFNSAWNGDLLAIKRLTLTFWGELRDQFPLKIAVTDANGLSPFQIAILRGHIDCAKGILEIAQAQFKPKDKDGNERYTMEEDSDYESSQASEASEDEDNIKVFREIVDDQFTIENIGEVATQVRSTTTPLAFLDWSCSIPQVKTNGSDPTVIGLDSHPLAGEWENAQAGDLFQYAIEKDDLDLLKVLLRWGTEYTAQYARQDDEQSSTPFYTRNGGDFTFALRLSRIRCLDELIKQTGIGLPLDKLLKKSGVEIVEKPKYYQGLSIHGKKRADWAAAGRGVTPQRVGNEHPPLLHAAKEGSLEGIEWFLSDAPARCYAEFAEKNKADKRLRHLEKANGGIRRAISDWLELRRKLSILFTFDQDLVLMALQRNLSFTVPLWAPGTLTVHQRFLTISCRPSRRHWTPRPAALDRRLSTSPSRSADTSRRSS